MSALTVRTVIDGTEYAQDDIRRWELDRSRTALTLLKDRIGDELMRELLAPDLRAADRMMAPLPGVSGGAWRSAASEMEIDGNDADGFLTW
ncbi:hypothetical protein ACIQZB_32640 [Streptomyces sp. NPDC097727]|uniref:hypothetical protein n=1 Tax=Streptomyces sp. NPDC097727 TaxID=3366092 RepID=UPI00381AE812